MRGCVVVCEKFCSGEGGMSLIEGLINFSCIQLA